MIVGHYSTSFAAPALARRVPLWTYFIAAQWLDICWSLLLLLGIEKVRIVPGFTEAHPFDHYYFPYSHSLAGAVVLSIVFGAVVAWTMTQDRIAVFAATSAVSLSHWLLDFLVHIPDLPLYDNATKVGLGLWRHTAISFPLELGLLIAGACIYARVKPSTNKPGRHALWGFVGALGLVHAYNTFGPPLASETLIAITGLASYLAIAALAAWVERIRSSPAQHEPGCTGQ